MKRLVWLFITLYALISVIDMSTVNAQSVGGDWLNETPLYPIPEGMTFEEYRDMNRRLTVGLALAAIPIPGMIHFYAGEKKTGWMILGSAAVGVTSLIAGISTVDEGDFPDSDFDVLILNPGDKERERRFEQIPFEKENGITTYRFREIYREPSGSGIALIVAGAAILIIDIAYDFIHGIRKIEEKRDRVRYKYGRQLKLGFNPQISPEKKRVGVQLALHF
ncbi:MAG: hypothetical protein D6732_10605 [Methanobacteriota archaeon]|nr:MAG: hypothetical protein D6732_10605 [Euryarchaeota archaeon]